MYLADDLFQYVFQSDEPCSLTVLIQNDGNIERRLAHFHKKLGNTLVFVSEICFPHNIADMELLHAVEKQQVFHVDRTNDIISRLFENRKACELIFAKKFDQLFIGTVHIGKCHMYPGDHYILRFGVA